MTALSKLETKKITRFSLWYNEYRYRLSITDDNLRAITDCNDYLDYCARLNQTVKTYKNKSKSKPYCDPYFVEGYLNEKLIKNIYAIKNSKVKFRSEYNSLSIFADDLSIFKKIVKCNAKSMKLSEAVVMPEGVIQFKRMDPPTQRRIYMSGKMVPYELKSELLEYIKKNPDIKPSTVLDRYLNNEYRYFFGRNEFYADKAFYLNYDNEHHAMMLHILFPNMFGKLYKLEKMTG